MILRRLRGWNGNNGRGGETITGKWLPEADTEVKETEKHEEKDCKAGI